MFENLRTIEVSTQSVVELAKSLRRTNLMRQLAEKAYEASEGKADAIEAVTRLSDELSEVAPTAADEDEFEFVSHDLDSLLEATYLAKGIRWRLQSLNRHLGSLRKGNFGFVFARPETGKTTFLTSECSYAAEQDMGPILHLNNEQVHEEVMLRYYQSTLGATLAQVMANRERANRVFMERTHGNIVMPRIGAFTAKTIERLCERVKPALIIVDQIDKVEGFDNDREDLKLGACYQWHRELSKEYGPVIGICQADGTGEGQKWLTMGNVANAKTSKQAEADWILGIGKTAAEGYEMIRYMHLCKNKLLGDEDTDPKLRHGKWETIIRPETGRYEDI